jgi:hypothetical protein
MDECCSNTMAVQMNTKAESVGNAYDVTLSDLQQKPERK